MAPQTRSARRVLRLRREIVKHADLVGGRRADGGPSAPVAVGGVERDLPGLGDLLGGGEPQRQPVRADPQLVADLRLPAVGCPLQPFALLLGGGYGWLLNKIKGGEMIIATYVGFSAISFMCMMWLLLPYTSPTMVWGMAGKGLRTTISLEGFYDKVLAKFALDCNKICGINLVIPIGTIAFFALLAFGMWAFLHTKTGTAMTAVGSNPVFARACGIDVDRIRLLSVIMSTWLAAVGILVYEQGFGFIQLYTAPNNMTLPAVAAILIGGASVNKASIPNVIIGTILFQGIVTMTPTVLNSLIHMDMSEVIRMIVSNGMIVYALTRKMGGKK